MNRPYHAVMALAIAVGICIIVVGSLGKAMGWWVWAY